MVGGWGPMTAPPVPQNQRPPMRAATALPLDRLLRAVVHQNPHQSFIVS